MKDLSVFHFWDNYIDKVISYGMTPRAARWPVWHAEAYSKAHTDTRLTSHSAQDVGKYGNDKGRDARR